VRLLGTFPQSPFGGAHTYGNDMTLCSLKKLRCLISHSILSSVPCTCSVLALHAHGCLSTRNLDLLLQLCIARSMYKFNRTHYYPAIAASVWTRLRHIIRPSIFGEHIGMERKQDTPYDGVVGSFVLSAQSVVSTGFLMTVR
jgi:hypothetical protein